MAPKPLLSQELGCLDHSLHHVFAPQAIISPGCPMKPRYEEVQGYFVFLDNRAFSKQHIEKNQKKPSLNILTKENIFLVRNKVN